MRHSSARRAGGFTLIELMISIAIGLLLTAMVAQLFIGSRRTYATTDDVSRMQENMRVASDVIGRTVRSIGYMSAPNTYSVATDGYPGIFTTTPALEGVEPSSATAPDSFTARFEGSGLTRGSQDNRVVDCLGNPTTANVISSNVFTIQNDPVTNAPGLFCNGTLVVPYVENMQVVYGVDTNGDTNADVFQPMASGMILDNIVAMRIALLFRTPGTQGTVRPNQDAKVYNLNGVDLPAFNDNFIRRTMTLTIALRNRTT